VVLELCTTNFQGFFDKVDHQARPTGVSTCCFLLLFGCFLLVAKPSMQAHCNTAVEHGHLPRYVFCSPHACGDTYPRNAGT
jgi:hypothetical protein